MDTLSPKIDIRGYEELKDINTLLLLREMEMSDDPILEKLLYEQARDQECSHISEVLEGIVSTNFEFKHRDGRLYVLQPNGVTDWLAMHENGVKRARAKAEDNPAFNFYVQIAEAELEEARAQEAMVQAGRPAVIVKLSLAGNDLASDKQLKQLGRNPELNRAYLRVSVFDGQKLTLYSRSLDGMNLTDGRDGITKGWGILENQTNNLPADASSIDILKTSRKFDADEMSLPEMRALPDQLVAAYDKVLFDRTGAVHKAGQPPESAHQTYAFVLNNPDLIKAHMDSLSEIAVRNLISGSLANDLRYDIMSSFKRRLDGSWVDTGNLAGSVSGAGSAERAIGTSYNGCDTSIGAGTMSSANSGYVNAGGRASWEWKTGTCIIENCPSRKRGRVEVGPCAVCRDCQALYDQKKDPYKEYYDAYWEETQDATDIFKASLWKIDTEIAINKYKAQLKLAEAEHSKKQLEEIIQALDEELANAA